MNVCTQFGIVRIAVVVGAGELLLHKAGELLKRHWEELHQLQTELRGLQVPRLTYYLLLRLLVLVLLLLLNVIKLRL